MTERRLVAAAGVAAAFLTGLLCGLLIGLTLRPGHRPSRPVAQTQPDDFVAPSNATPTTPADPGTDQSNRVAFVARTRAVDTANVPPDKSRPADQANQGEAAPESTDGGRAQGEAPK